VPVEFARQSDNGRMTLVLVSGVKPVPSLWVRLKTADMAAAKEALRLREGPTNIANIGFWTVGQEPPALIPDLVMWAKAKGLDGVVWTALGARFNNDLRTPSVDDVVAYLRSLGGQEKALAEEYVRKAPRQTATTYRAAIERELGWTSRE